MISVCITLGFSLQHLSNLEDHVPSFKIIFHIRKLQRIKKNTKQKGTDGDAPTPEKRKTNVFYCFENAKNVS